MTLHYSHPTSVDARSSSHAGKEGSHVQVWVPWGASWGITPNLPYRMYCDLSMQFFIRKPSLVRPRGNEVSSALLLALYKHSLCKPFHCICKASGLQIATIRKGNGS
jgi:hypothetical protein